MAILNLKQKESGKLKFYGEYNQFFKNISSDFLKTVCTEDFPFFLMKMGKQY